MVIGIKEIMEQTGAGRKTVTKWLNMKSCPTLPRKKGQTFKVDAEAFKRWLECQ